MITVSLPDPIRLTREFHVARDARQRYGITGSIVDLRGRVMVADPAAAEHLAARINEARDARHVPGVGVSGAEILAAALLDEAVHLMLAAYRRERDPTWSARLDAHLTERLGAQRVASARAAFVLGFPPGPVMREEVAPDAWLAGRVDDLPAREVALEERIAVRLANENPALERFRELVDDRELGPDDAALARLMEGRLADMPGLPGQPQNDLWSMLRAPMRASPTSLEGQLAYVRDHWGAQLGPAFATLLTRLGLSLDLLAELRAGGPAGPPGPAPILDAKALSRGRDEPEAYSPDADWMPSVVLVAKNAYVWLDQLSRWTGRAIRRLDEVPDEALADLRANGFSGLWLIGLWQRSEASARIKRMRGQEDAVASAYSLDDYRIADDLGGYDAWRALRDRAARHGLRLAADMVPNHVGIDGRWVIERPDYFLSLPESPYPGYTFHGPNLSSDDRVEVRIEDGYWESRDAAVVFERLDRATGDRRYVYHGNDGTSMPWNDTAQIDYLNPEAREAVIHVILEVARMFPIIRFDAAMTLAKQHVQRLWYPQPGHGGAIPSRSTYGSMDEDEFERRMPVEFWREVVDRVAVEAPDTLLLAEAFWMMEGYFVRSLGMHRVYNSAFMNMLSREANDDYQQLMRNVLSFDPQILQRFVNFMNNPDEETAIAQFGDGDKAFGVATLMATLPGLPMFGHGQVEGLHEKYGMEYRRAKLDERPNEGMVARHRAEVAPLLDRRRAFAGIDRFRLFVVDGDHGPLPDVFAYANGEPGGPMNLVLYHNRYGEARGRIQRTVPFGSGGPTREEGVTEALGLHGGADRFVRYRELLSGREHLVRADAWREGGLPVRLGAYERRVLLDVHEVRDPDGRWAKLHDRLEGAGVPSLDEALREMDLEPVHLAFVALARDADAAGGSRRAPDDAPATGSEASSDPGPTVTSETPSETPSRTPSLAARVAVLARRIRDQEPSLRFDVDRAVTAVAAADAADAAGAPDAQAAADASTRSASVTPVVPGRAGADRASSEELDEPESAQAEADVPSAGWRRAWALAQGFERPADAARRLRLDRAVARWLVEDAPPYVPARAWGTLWTALLPHRADDAASADDARGTHGRTAPTAATTDAPEPTGASKPTDPSPRAALAALAGADDVRSVLGVHEHEGVRWFRQEGFRAWRDAWLAVQGLRGVDAATLADWASELNAAERASGYRFDRLIAPADGADETETGAPPSSDDRD